MTRRKKASPNHRLSQRDAKPTPSRLRPEYVFAVLGLAAGLFMAIVTPPFQSPDEPAHLFRAFQLSQGRIIPEKQKGQVGGNLPVALEDANAPFTRMRFYPLEKLDADRRTRDALLRQPLAEEDTTFLEFMHTAIYTPVAYAPAIVGIWVARLFNASALHLLYVSRLATLFCWLALIFAAIRITPVFKWVMVLLALMPMAIFIGASLTADAMTDALAILLVALILRSALALTSLMTWQEAAWIILLCVLIAATKQVYFLLAAMVLMVPKTRFTGTDKRILFVLGAIGAAIATNIIWAILVHDRVMTEPWAAPKTQLNFIVAHPWAYICLLGRTLYIWWWMYIAWFIGVLGWLDTWLPLWVYFGYVPVLIAAAILDRGGARVIRPWERVLIAAICLATILLIVTSQYITYTAPGALWIRGVQGRYFLPLAVPMLLVLYNRKLKIRETWLGDVTTIWCTVVLLVTCWTLYNRYY